MRTAPRAAEGLIFLPPCIQPLPTTKQSVSLSMVGSDRRQSMPYGLASRCRLIFHVRAARWIRRSGSKATKNTWGRAATYLGGHQIVTCASGPWWFGEGVRRIPPAIAGGVSGA